MTKNIFASAINAFTAAEIQFSKTMNKADASKWVKARKSIISLLTDALLNIQGGATKAIVKKALMNAFKNAIAANPEIESEIKAFRAAIVKAFDAMDSETATPDLVAEFVNRFPSQNAWRAFFRKAIASDETADETAETSDTSEPTTDATLLASILQMIASAEDSPAMVKAIIAAQG